MRIVMECDVIDHTALWDAAVDRAEQDFALTPDDIVDTIGPREDPEIEACVFMIFEQMLRTSGAFDAFGIVLSRPGAGAGAEASAAVAPLARPRIVNGDVVAALRQIHSPRAA